MKAKTTIPVALICMAILFIFSCKKQSQGYYGNYVGTVDSVRAGLADTTIADTFNVSPYFSSATSVSFIQISSGETIHATLSGTALSFPSQNTVIDGYNLTWSGSGTLNGGALTLSLFIVDQHNDSTKISFKGTQVKQ